VNVLRTCEFEGCTTLTLGTLCAAHEEPVDPTRFPRGRPFREESAVLVAEVLGRARDADPPIEIRPEIPAAPSSRSPTDQ
jgi:hypothetical protein